LIATIYSKISPHLFGRVRFDDELLNLGFARNFYLAYNLIV
jgi:exonuclease I